MEWIPACLIAFLLGSLPWGLWIGFWTRGIDVRRHGSGNLGATNVYRVLGRGPGLLVLALDAAKGAAGVIAARWIMGASGAGETLAQWAALVGLIAVILGHAFSPFARFRGGKGVAAAAGAWLALAPGATGIALLIFGLVFAATRIVSAGSICASLGLPLSVYFLGGPAAGIRDPRFWFAALTALLIVIRHRSNLSRLLRREEKPLDLRGGGGGSSDRGGTG